MAANVTMTCRFLEMSRSPPQALSSLGKSLAILGTEVVPDPGIDLEQYTTTDGFSPEDYTISTASLLASMLPREEGGVVDGALRVYYETANVRVVDASVIPLHVSAHPQGTIYGIAEMAADIILSR